MDFGTAFSSVIDNFKQINMLENSISITLSVLCAIGLGLLVVLFYNFINRGSNFSFEFTLTLVTVAGVIAMIISVIGTNIASAFSLAGLMSIVRFRSLQQKTSDIAFIFISMAAGVACGVGLIAPGVVFVIIIGIIVDAYTLISRKFRRENKMLVICVPESESRDKQFDDILKKYSSSFNLHRVRLTNAGTVMELSYVVSLNPSVKTEEMLSEIRERNSNFNVMLTYVEDATVRDK
jgi:uncharacterized membrane protein YhiD involved in acid resistance